MDASVFELSIEQQFTLQSIINGSEQMTKQQLQESLISATRLLMIKDNFIRGMLKHD